MTAQVIFLNTLYFPDQEERARLENMQDYITYCHTEYEYSRKETPDKSKKALKEQTHKRARERIHLVPEQD